MRFSDSYWQQRIKDQSASEFDALAMDLFRWQYQENSLYQAYCQLVNRPPDKVNQPSEIPFFPIQFFKSHLIQCGDWTPEHIFRSSGTTGSEVSQHLVKDMAWYKEVTLMGCEKALSHPSDYAWLCLLPGYLERGDSSLVSMTSYFVSLSDYGESGFFLDDFKKLHQTIKDLNSKKIPTILLGVTHALLRFAEAYPSSWSDNLIVMETGGMKGHGPERIREEVHEQLRTQLGVSKVYSEYGMTELFSQAYATDGNGFVPAPTMQVTIRDMYDPFHFPGYGRPGVICVTDLANYATLSFIATEDIGRVRPDGAFDVLGRLDGSEVRGCNLMVNDAIGEKSID